MPTCVECGARWLPDDKERWRLVEVDVWEFGWYCRSCAERELDESGCG